MATIEIIHILTLFAAALIIVGILSSLIAARVGAPLLLVFLVVGMLVGEDGPGQIPFNDYSLTYLIGSIGLAVILFDGGLRTRLAAFRGVLVPAALLSTVGVVITACLTGLLASTLLGLTLLEGLLVGAMVASTDAAAVFFLLRTGGLQLRSRVKATLEIESGTNDPAAIFLTLLFVGLVLARGSNMGLATIVLLLQQGLIGAIAGLAFGYLITLALNHLDLPSGLHPLFVVASAIALFALVALLGGSGFLAVYLAGLVVGNRPIRAAASITAFHDTATWLCQISMFIILGLLVTPSKLVPYLLPALGISVFLMLVARPIAVVLCLAPFRFPLAEQGFIAWVGLRGAVSIFLAAIPTLANVPDSAVYFNVIFVVVFVSLLVQGWTISPLARRLGIALPRLTRPIHRVEIDLPGQLAHEMVGYPVAVDSPVLHDASVPVWARPVFVVRDDRILEPIEAGALSAGDYAYFLAPHERVPFLDRLFAGESAAATTVGVPLLPIRATARLSFLADLYGADIAGEDRETSVADLFERSFGAEAAAGDRLSLGNLILVARAMDGERVTEAAIMLGDDDPPATEGAAQAKPGSRPKAGWRARLKALIASRGARPGSGS